MSSLIAEHHPAPSGAARRLNTNEHGHVGPHRHMPTPGCGNGTQRGHAIRRGFTLVELIVVLAILSMLAITTLPTLARMWQVNQGANSENMLKGLLRSARMRALGDKESGLFFFVESDVQKIVFIEADPPDLTEGSPDLGPDEAVGGGDDVTEQDTADRFRVLEGNVYELPAPFRVVPLSVLIEDGAHLQYWSKDELGNEDYDSPNVLMWDGAQNHRNFFSILFSPQGHLIVDRPVLIHDLPPDDPDPLKLFRGDGRTTGLAVEIATEYQAPTGTMPGAFSPTASLPAMLLANDVALNFPSVDGLLVYDDSSFKEFPDGPLNPPEVDQRRYLRRSGQPLYISRQSGAIIRGPLGENES